MAEEILTPHSHDRTKRVRLIVIHVNVGPDTHGGAPALARFCQTQVGGYHLITDDIQTVIGAHDDQVVAGAAGANEDGYHICLLGMPDQTVAQWHDEFSVAAWTRAADETRAACQRFGVPMRLLSAAEVASGAAGICGHVQVSNAYHLSTHWDPGPNFPWAEFMARVNASEEDIMLDDADKAYIKAADLDVVRKEGISANALAARTQAAQAVAEAHAARVEIAALAQKVDAIVPTAAGAVDVDALAEAVAQKLAERLAS